MPLKRSSPRGGVLRVVLWIVSALVVLGLAAFFLINHYLRQKYEPVLLQVRQELADNVDFFCAQQEELARDPWFHEPRTEGDAGPLLNAWLPWEPKNELPRNSPLTVPPPLPQTSQELKDWLTASIDVSTLDFGWMRQLSAYDRWDILLNTPTPPAPRLDWPNAPIPNFIPLILWSKFRLLHGLKTGQPIEAARDVRQLAWLAYRTDMVLGAAIAKTLLALERQAYDSMPSPPAGWQPMSEEQLERMRAVIRTGHMFSHLAADPEVAQRARHCGEPAVTRCIALGEEAFFAQYLRPIAEKEYKEAYTALAADLAGPPCATSVPQTVWAKGLTVQEAPGAVISDRPSWVNSPAGVFAGSHMVGILLAIAVPNLKELHDFRSKLESGQFKAKAKP